MHRRARPGARARARESIGCPVQSLGRPRDRHDVARAWLSWSEGWRLARAASGGSAMSSAAASAPQPTWDHRCRPGICTRWHMGYRGGLARVARWPAGRGGPARCEPVPPGTAGDRYSVTSRRSGPAGIRTSLGHWTSGASRDTAGQVRHTRGY